MDWNLIQYPLYPMEQLTSIAKGGSEKLGGRKEIGSDLFVY